MPFTLREPALPDAPQIAELHVATWRETYSHLLPEDFFTQEHVQSRHQMWNHILGNPREEWSIRIAESRGADHRLRVLRPQLRTQLRTGRPGAGTLLPCLNNRRPASVVG